MSYASYWPRAILHVDMDAFYASVEQRDDPSLRERPVIVGGIGGRGVVAAASYEARAFGVHSAMPVRKALERCPEAICVRPRMAHYAAVSAKIFDIFTEFTPQVEGLSLDEAFLDITASQTLLGEPAQIAQEIKKRIRDDLQLNASVGVAPNKLVAKIASDLNKPNGLCVISNETLTAKLDPLSIRRLPGLGRKKGEQVIAAGIDTLAALRSAPEATLRALFGKSFHEWRQRAAGVDDRPVQSERDEKSVSNERTFATDLDDPAVIRAELYTLADKVSTRLRSKALRARCIGIKLREHDFTTITRQATIAPATCESRIIVETVQRLLAQWLTEHHGARLRLLGVSASDLQPELQGDLFATEQRTGDSRLDDTLDDIREKFGSMAVGRASVLPRLPVIQASSSKRPQDKRS
jgi:DNA polymerase-4